MDTTTVAVVVVRMTGLLLLTPSNPSNARPTHVLIPKTSYPVPIHFAQIGYRAHPDPGNCATYVDGICYLDMDGWSMDISAGANPGGSIAMPSGAANVSDAVQKPLPKELLNDFPDMTRLRSRITLHAGQEKEGCALAKWKWTPQSTGIETHLDLANVVEWEIPNMPLTRGRLLLVRKRLDGLGTPETIDLGEPGGSGTIELFVRHIPTDELDHRPSNVGPPTLGHEARHFQAYYDLLGHQGGNRPIPRVSRTVGYPRGCRWQETGSTAQLLPRAARVAERAMDARAAGPTWRSPGMLSCMVASAKPES